MDAVVIWVRPSEMGLPRTIGMRLAAALSCVSFVLLACTSQPPTTSAVTPASVAPSPDVTRAPKHQSVAGDAPLVVIFMENHEQSDVAGSSSATYQNAM